MRSCTPAPGRNIGRASCPPLFITCKRFYKLFCALLIKCYAHHVYKNILTGAYKKVYISHCTDRPRPGFSWLFSLTPRFPSVCVGPKTPAVLTRNRPRAFPFFYSGIFLSSSADIFIIRKFLNHNSPISTCRICLLVLQTAPSRAQFHR